MHPWHLWQLLLMLPLASRVAIRDHRRPGWFWIDNEIIDIYGRRLGTAGVMLYMALARNVNNLDQSVAVPYERLAALALISPSTARRAAKKLVAVGLLAIEQQHDERGQVANVFTLLEPTAETPLGSGADREARGEQNTCSPPCQNDTPPLSKRQPPPIAGDNPPLSPVTTRPFKQDLTLKTTDGSADVAHATDPDAVADAAELADVATPGEDEDPVVTVFDQQRMAALDRALKDPDRPPHLTVQAWADMLQLAAAVEGFGVGRGAR